MKKIIAVVFCALLIFTLAGCGCGKDKAESEDFTDATGEMKKEIVTVYFPDGEAMYLNGEERTVEAKDKTDLAKNVVEEILRGPKTEGLNKAINGGVKIISLSVDDNGLCTVNFSKEFEECNTGGSAMESMAIYSVVNSLCLLEGVDKVKINIDGNSEAEYGGHFYLGDAFEFDPNMMRPEDKKE